MDAQGQGTQALPEYALPNLDAGGEEQGGLGWEMLTHIDLFSGIGGFALAARWAGFRTVAFVEIEPYAQGILKQNFGAVADDAQSFDGECDGRQGKRQVQQSGIGDRARIFSDIRAFDGTRFGGATLLTGGFPCQPFSQAGKRRGKEDDRYLWPEMLRVISQARPAWVVGENVAGIVSMELDRVLSDLEGEGYAVQALIIPACAVDAKHRRDRVWIVGHAEERTVGAGLRESEPRRERRRRFSDSGGKEALENTDSRRFSEQGICEEQSQRTEVVGSGENVADAAPRGIRCGETSGSTGQLAQCSEDVANAMQSGRSGRRRTSGFRRGIRSEGNSNENGRQGNYVENVQWLPEPDVGRVANGVSTHMDCIAGVPIESAPKRTKGKTAAGRVHRLKGLGNAIVPQVVYQVLKGIAEIERL